MEDRLVMASSIMIVIRLEGWYTTLAEAFPLTHLFKDRVGQLAVQFCRIREASAMMQIS